MGFFYGQFKIGRKFSLKGRNKIRNFNKFHQRSRKSREVRVKSVVLSVFSLTNHENGPRGGCLLKHYLIRRYFPTEKLENDEHVAISRSVRSRLVCFSLLVSNKYHQTTEIQIGSRNF